MCNFKELAEDKAKAPCINSSFSYIFQAHLLYRAGPGAVPNADPLQTDNQLTNQHIKIVHCHQLRAPKTAGPGAAAPLTLPLRGTGSLLHSLKHATCFRASVDQNGMQWLFVAY